MTYNIIISATARTEEAEAYLYYEEKSEGLGERFLSEVQSTLKQIAENPTFYTYCDPRRILRDVALPKFPFVIIYEMEDNKIIVTNIHHTRKEPK